MYCPECGFHQSEAHKYCGRCGALLIVENQGTGEITGPFAHQRPGGRDRGLAGPGHRGPDAGRARRRASRARLPARPGQRSPSAGALGRRLPGRRDGLAQPRRHHAPARGHGVCATSEASTAPTSTAGASRARRSSRTGTSSRSASSDSRSCSGEPSPPSCPDERAARRRLDDHRRGLRPAARRAPHDLDLEDPLPRGSAS